MKRFLLVICLCFFLPVAAKSFTETDFLGDFQGTLDVGVAKLRLVFHIEKVDGEFKASVDSIDQGAKGIPVSEVSIKDGKIKLKLPIINAVYTGEMKVKGTITGSWMQGGRKMPLTIKKTLKPVKLLRPQLPKKPYPYKSEDVYFVNKKDNIKLGATFTCLQKSGKFPAVVLISGSGAQNRDEELMGHKPFLVLADFLTKNNIAVLRFDDRGVGESEGNFQSATTFDFAEDVKWAIEYLKSRNEVDKNKIGLIGHSEGGIVAPIVALNNSSVRFIIMLAGPTIRGDKLLLAQNKLILKDMGMDDDTLKKYLKEMELEFKCILESKNEDEGAKLLIEKSTAYFKENFKNLNGKFGMKEENIKVRAKIYSTPWFRTFLKLDPAVYLKKVKVPVLALYGEKDMQVPVPLNSYNAYKLLQIQGNQKSKVVVLKDCNHLFQTCETGSIANYSKIEETISPKVLNIILKWTKDTLAK